MVFKGVFRGGVLVMFSFLVLSSAGCEQLIPANQAMMKEAIEASDQAVRSEEKTWAYVLRMEELTRRLEEATRQAQAASLRAETAARSAEAAAEKVETASKQAAEAANKAGSKLRQADVAGGDLAAAVDEARTAAAAAEAAAHRIEQQEGETLQKMLEFLRELGYKP